MSLPLPQGMQINAPILPGFETVAWFRAGRAKFGGGFVGIARRVERRREATLAASIWSDDSLFVFSPRAKSPMRATMAASPSGTPMRQVRVW